MMYYALPAWPTIVLWRNVAHACEHGHTAMLQLHIATTAEGGGVVSLGKTQWIPKAHGRLHAKLALEGGRASVKPIRSAEQAVLHQDQLPTQNET